MRAHTNTNIKTGKYTHANTQPHTHTQADKFARAETFVVANEKYISSRSGQTEAMSIIFSNLLTPTKL